jgi:hypothetical protein
LLTLAQPKPAAQRFAPKIAVHNTENAVPNVPAKAAPTTNKAKPVPKPQPATHAPPKKVVQKARPADSNKKNEPAPASNSSKLDGITTATMPQEHSANTSSADQNNDTIIITVDPALVGQPPANTTANSTINHTSVTSTTVNATTDQSLNQTNGNRTRANIRRKVTKPVSPKFATAKYVSDIKL